VATIEIVYVRKPPHICRLQIAQGRAKLQGANATAPTKGKVMSRMSSLGYSASAAAVAPEGEVYCESVQRGGIDDQTAVAALRY